MPLRNRPAEVWANATLAEPQSQEAGINMVGDRIVCYLEITHLSHATMLMTPCPPQRSSIV